MTTLNVTNEVANELEKLLLATDKIQEVEPTTEKHYSLNLRFEVVRENKKYFIAIKKVDVSGSEVKSHVRLEVDTDLPSNEKLQKQQKKQELLEKKLQKIAELEIKKQEHKKEYLKAKNENCKINQGYHLFQYNEYKKQIEKLYRR
jgi:hypothetical protein